MKKSAFILCLGLVISLTAFFLTKEWEEEKRQHEFNVKAQSHTTAIRDEFVLLAKQIENIRFLIEYDVNSEHENPLNPQNFMPMIEPLIIYDPALVDLAWAVVQSGELRIIYSGKGHTLKETLEPQLITHLFTSNIHTYADNKHELQLTATVTDQLQQAKGFNNRDLAGTPIGSVITEWKVAPIVERALQNMPVSAQDITLSVLSPNGEQDLVYFHQSRSRSLDEVKVNTNIEYITRYDYAGLQWQLTFQAAPQFLRDFPIILAWQILAMGLLLSMLFAWYTHRESKYTQRIEQKVNDRTKELAKSESHFRSIVHGLQDVYYQTDINGIVQIVSPSVRNLGYEIEEVVGSNIAIYYFDTDGRDQFIQALSASPHGKVYNYHIKVLHKDGSTRWTSTNSQFIYDEQNNPIGVEGTLRDFTKEKEQQEAEQHTDRLESLGILAGGIAHDFNNILTAIIGNASLARKENQEQTSLVRYLDNIEHASMNAADLCKQMLAYAGKGKYFIQPVNLSTITDDISQLIQSSLATNVTTAYHYREHLPTIEADTAQMQQLIMNLITNASEAYGDQAGIVSIATGVIHADRDYLKESVEGAMLEPADYVYIEVSDSGCGMDEEIQKKMFEPFFTTKFTGRGLGMSAIRGILSGHHGAMHIDSQVGKGTTIQAFFPISTKSIATKEDSVQWQGSGTVLIVDDDKDVCNIASAMLENMGYNTLVAYDGQQGVETFAHNAEEISLVLLDMTMPIMDGLACFTELRKIKPHVCVILSSGYAEEETTAQFPENSLAGFLQKPYLSKDLAKVMKTVQKEQV